MGILNDGWERDEFMRLKQRVDQLERKGQPGTWWLIEVGSPTTYFCGDGDWCSNPHHAHRFATKDEAQAKASTLRTLDPVRICDHAWD